MDWQRTEGSVVIDDPLDVARDPADPEQRLPGERESEASPLIEDAQHWLHVYAELLTFKQTLVETAAVEGAVESGGAGRRAVSTASGEGPGLRSELERLGRRHAFWRERVARLTSA
jgi:hypothetical protein